ncbi:MAG: siphovirus Gp157 family protein [Synechococcaceae cyanobacterium RM1_1_27]|nr:siphovirus Gp157 family protein [Synechococcaceae cyanobacterium RM1_1_27]
MTTLWEIDHQLAAAINQLEAIETDDGLTDVFESYVAELESERDEKIANWGRFILHQESLAEAAQAEADRIRKLADTRSNRAKSMKDLLKLYFEREGLKKIETATAVVSLAKNGGKAPIKLPDDLSELPDDYTYPIFKPDLDRIREDLEAGEKIPGCSLGERGFHLRIR